MISDWVGCGWMSAATSSGSASQLKMSWASAMQLADPAADQVNAEDPSRLAAGRGRRLGDHLGLPLRLQDDALAVAAERVVHLDHADAALLRPAPR